MNTATQLLERCKWFLMSIYDAKFSEADEYTERESCLKHIEAYLAKQQINNQSITYCYFDNSKELNGYRSAK
jgi:hypothetical protein